MKTRSIAVFYVALYFCQQCYGGPEEGGWYYDSGERKGKVKAFATKQEARKFQERAQRCMDAWHEENKVPLHSSVSRGAYHVEFHGNDYPPDHYPETRPFYE